MSDNLDVIAKDLIPVRVVEVIVRVEDVLDRLVCERLNALDQPACGCGAFQRNGPIGGAA